MFWTYVNITNWFHLKKYGSLTSPEKKCQQPITKKPTKTGKQKKVGKRKKIHLGNHPWTLQLEPPHEKSALL